ncbi:MAG: M4 family metallopeptidase [Bacteroidia bacterium]|nr:M4 family metallopeptidase [Bacteroidia bacterium]
MTSHTFFRISALTIVLCLFSLSAAAQGLSKQRVIDAHKKAVSGDVDVSSIGERFQSWKQSNDVLARHSALSRVRGLGIDQILAYSRLYDQTPGLHVTWDESGRVPISITGKPLQRSMSTAAGSTVHERTVREFFRRFASLLALDADAEALTLTSSHTDETGRTHLRFSQLRNGLPVLGKEAICGVTAAGDMDLFMGRLAALDVPVSGTFVLTEREALTTAEEHIAPRLHGHDTDLPAGLSWDSTPVIRQAYAEHDGGLRAVFSIELRPSPADRWQCVVDAESGLVLSAFNTICADGPVKAQATDLHGATVTLDTYDVGGTYFMIDATRPMFNAANSVFPNATYGTILTLTANNTDLKNITHVVSGANTWSDPSSVSAHHHAGLVYEYYRTTHNRNSLDNKGGSIISIVNVTMGGTAMENAFWNGQFISYGNGGSLFEPFAKALDMAAHEFTHGVTEFSAGLEYRNQSGALNESFSDIFAMMVDRDDWTFAEDITKPGSVFPSGAARSLEDPHNGASQGSPAWQPKHMNEFQNLPEDQDNGGVHINSGIPNHAAYLLAQQIGREKTERIMYRALTTKLTRQARFIDFRLAIIRSAEELYGSAEALACASACDQVGITDGSGTGKPVDYPPVAGTDRMLFVNTDPFLPAPLWIVTPPGTDQNDFSSISYSGIWSRPSISDDGTMAVFVDDEFNIRAIALAGAPNEQVLDASGVWNSVAINRGGQQLAITSILPGAMIYGIDLSGPTMVTQDFPVYTPTYTGTEIPNTAVFADALDFSLDGRTLIFDAYNEITVGQVSYGFWDINTLDFWDKNSAGFGTGRIDRVFPQEPEINIGNPSWAETKQSVITFDVQFPVSGTAWVMTMDLLTREPNPLAEIPSGTFGYPTFSGNDKILSFVRSDTRDIVFNTPMADDAVTATGNPVGFIAEATFPVWFRTGTRPVSVESPALLPIGMELAQNYPNPFNPSTRISFTIAQRAHAKLTVHDMLGRTVKTLADGVLDKGQHTTMWDGRDATGISLPSGVYLYRLQSDGSILTRRMVLAQ